MRAWGRLLRLSLFPTAAADVAAGIVAGGGEWPTGPRPFLLMLGSLCVYHGGMALNDWADRKGDARARPDRPIPSGAIGARYALVLSLALLAAGPVFACGAGPRTGAVLLAVAAAAALYDLFGRGPCVGPLLLAFCRAGNLCAGLSLAGAAPALLATLPPLYGAYVFLVSRLGRLEDIVSQASIGRGPPRILAAAAACLVAAPLVAMVRHGAPTLGASAALVLSLAGAAGLALAARRRTAWDRASVLAAMGMSLRRLLVFTSAAALCADSTAGWIVGGAILLGYPVSYSLRGVFPPS